MVDFLFNYLRINVHGLISISSALLIFLLGSFIGFKDWKSKINGTFFLFSLSAATWLFGFGMASLVEDVRNARFWLKAAYLLGVPFISPMIYLFSLSWLN